jgi:hypothetical protein
MTDARPDRLTISFWIWGLFDSSPNGYFDHLEGRLHELQERGFNCIRLEAGAGLCHDREGRRRGALTFQEALPGGHMRTIRQMDRFLPGTCDPLERLIRLCTAAKRTGVRIILSSWYYLHTNWFTDDAIDRELQGLPWPERFAYFARALDRILGELKQRDLHGVIAFAEIMNEVDALEYVCGHQRRGLPKTTLEEFRNWHEEALAGLRHRHPDILFALDTAGAAPVDELMTRNAQVWNFHHYYLWPVYDLLERGVTWEGGQPTATAPVRRFLRRELLPFPALRGCRGERRPIWDDWYRRIWVYRNLDPAALPALEQALQEDLAKNIALYKSKVDEGLAQALALRARVLPGVPFVLGEGASYCADTRLRWEERSDAYWEVVEHAARTYREHGAWGTVVRTNSGPDDPTWLEYPERLRRVNEVFLRGG